MNTNYFRNQLKSFTQRGKEVDQAFAEKTRRLEVNRAFTNNVEVVEIPQQIEKSKQEKYAEAQISIQNFLRSTCQAQKRCIADELTNNLSILKDQDKQDIDIYASINSNSYISLAKQQKQKEEQFKIQQKQQQNDEIDKIILKPALDQFIDNDIVYKNENFFKYTFVLASYLDLKNSSLFVQHYNQCLKMCTLANKCLVSQGFLDFVNQEIVPCDSNNLYQTLLSLNADITDQLIRFFKYILLENDEFRSIPHPTKKQTSYLQSKLSQDAYEQFFVTACFWKLCGGRIQLDAYERFPEFV